MPVILITGGVSSMLNWREISLWLDWRSMKIDLTIEHHENLALD